MVFGIDHRDSSEIAQNLRRSPNINAAVKSFLKREVKKGDGAERFIKDLRDVLLSKNEQLAAEFLERRLSQYEPYVVALGGYAHADFVTALAGRIVEKYADEFNATYQVWGESVTVADPQRFNQIVGEVLKLVADEIDQKGLPGYFMKCVILNAIFDRPVLMKVLEQLGE